MKKKIGFGENVITRNPRVLLKIFLKSFFAKIYTKSYVFLHQILCFAKIFLKSYVLPKIFLKSLKLKFFSEILDCEPCLHTNKTMDMPFANVSDNTFLELFADFEWEETASGEWTFGQWWYLSGVGWKFEPLIDQRQDADPEQAQLNDALHFGYETYGQDRPAPLLAQDPLDYPPYDYDDPRDLD